MRAVLLTFMVFVLALINAQPFQITFSGSGLSNAVDSVEVLNLTQGTTLTIAGADTLELVDDTGVSDLSSDRDALRIYPNPVRNQCRVEFYNDIAGVVSLGLYDETGRLVLRNESFLTRGNHSYNLGGIGQGLFVLKVVAPSQRYSERIISTGKAEVGSPFLKYLGLTSVKYHQPRLAESSGTVQMTYLTGEMLLFKGISGNHSRVITLFPVSSQTVNFEFIDCIDGDGNHYPVVTIGTQTWMAENLKTTRYINGTAIPDITVNSTWIALASGACCWYDNDSASYADVYGALYNWHAVDDTNGLCPAGWHVPTDMEWQTLEIYLGMSQLQANLTGWRGTDEGGRLKETGTVHWESPNLGAINSSGFTALPGGYRFSNNGNFFNIGHIGYWWTSTPYSATNAYYRTLYHLYNHISRSHYDERSGRSVRCVMDN